MQGYTGNTTLDTSQSKSKEGLEQVFERSQGVEEQLERTSATIYDIIGPRMEDRNFLPSMLTMVRQLADWGMFNPVPKAESTVYKEIYSRLSADVHVVPNRLDIGRRITSESPDIFRQEVLPEELHKYAASLHALMDLAVVIELNVMKSLIDEYEESRVKLIRRLETLTSLHLKHSVKRAKQLVASTT